MDEIQLLGVPNQVSIRSPQAGLFVFTAKHYSMVWSPSEMPRPTSAHTWHPTEAEKVTAFNTLIVNTGRYTLADSFLTTYPLAAKTEEFAGGSALYRCHIHFDTLWLTTLTTTSRYGIQDSLQSLYPTALRLLRIE